MKLSEMLENLKKPVPSQFISVKKIRNESIRYVNVWQYYELLDERCGLDGWEITLTPYQIGSLAVIKATLTITGSDRSLTREGIGNEKDDVETWGDSTSNAESQAIRRVCAKFGLSRELWLKEKDKSPSLPNISQSQPKGTISREEWLRRKNKPELPKHTYAETYD